MKKSLGSIPAAWPTPVWCVGTFDSDSRPNFMTVAWGGICNSKPVCLTVSIRKATYTYSSILERKAFTVSIPSTAFVKPADYFGTVSGRDTDKAADAGLTYVRSDLVDAPYIKEFPVVIECRLLHHYDIGLHTLFIGEVADVKADETCFTDGKPDMKKIDPLIFSPEERNYYGTGDYAGQAFSIGKDLKGGG